MFIKRFLIYSPLVLIIFLAQSFFWVPTYDKQAVGNPERLKKYIRGSSGDAEILNPVISADTASSSINSLVFDGLIALDDKLEYRPRLAGDAQELTKWAQAIVGTNPGAVKRRREVKNIEIEWRLSMPTGVTFDTAKNRLFIADTQRNRLQIYDKLKEYAGPQRNL